MQRFNILGCLAAIIYLVAANANAATVRGELNKWFPVTVDFNGPSASETDDPVNPFLDYRLNVEFTSPSGKVTLVPGFFAGDGQGGAQGHVWRVRFSADEVGQWRYQGHLHEGVDIAVNLDPEAGNRLALEGASGIFEIGPRNDGAPGFLKHGRLEYVGGHYMKFRDGPYWIKGGTDSPENLLGYAGFDGTVDQGGINANFLHDFAAHRNDFNAADPLFSNNETGADSRGLIGALNYLGEQGVNSVYFLPMNLGGDGQETFPFVGAANNRYNKTHYDISKLYQWNLVLNHAQEQGVALNVVLSETEPENERWLDNGALGVERKLYFRELIARFGYLLAVKWNLGEENDFRLEQLQLHASYIQALDWTNKPIAVHTHINQFFRYGEIVGDPRFSASSIQYDPQFAGQFVETWRANSANAGHPWIIDMDENTNGLGTDGIDVRRKQILYDVLFSGGNIEWYFGYSPQPVGGDIDAGNFRYREDMWRQMRLAREMMEREMPFWRMQPADDLVQGDRNDFGGAEVFVLDGEFYAIYLPATNGSETLNMRGADGLYRQRWFDPRTGQMSNGQTNIAPSGNFQLGSPPTQTGQDWVVLISRESSSPGNPINVPSAPQVPGNTAPSFQELPNPSVREGQSISLTVTATDSDGTFPVVTVGQIPGGMRVQGLGNGRLKLDWNAPAGAVGAAQVELISIDAMDRSLVTRQVMTINVVPDEQTADLVMPTEPQTPGVPADNTPRFTNLPTPTVRAGEFLELTLTAVSSRAIAPIVTVGEIPAGMRISGPGNGRLILTWQVPENADARSIVELIAMDAADRSVRNVQEMVIMVASGQQTETPVPADIPQTDPAASAPVLRPVPAKTVRIGEVLSVRIHADDADGFPPALVVVNSPATAAFLDNGDGTRTFSWRPTETDVGRRVFTIVARDHSVAGLSDTLELIVDVVR
jgi:hypothetical protein